LIRAAVVGVARAGDTLRALADRCQNWLAAWVARASDGTVIVWPIAVPMAAATWLALTKVQAVPVAAGNGRHKPGGAVDGLRSQVSRASGQSV
jgi:hypothetical protein